MNRVEVTKCMVGVFGMQVCAENDVTDKEILKVCNTENPSGTEAGWGVVLRPHNLEDNNMPDNCAPVACDDDAGRHHFLVLC